MAATALLLDPDRSPRSTAVRTTGTRRGVTPSAPHPPGYRAASRPAGPVRARAASARRRSEAAARARRRRLFVGAAGLALVFVVAHAGAAAGDDVTGGPGRPAAEPTVRVVQPGDTLWAIAGELAPDRDRRVVVDELVRARDGRVDLRPGERIVWLGR